MRLWGSSRPTSFKDLKQSTISRFCSTPCSQKTLPPLQEGSLPHLSVQDLARILQKCGKERNRAYGSHLHAYMRTHGLQTHELLGNYLVPMLVELGSIRDAQQVFEGLPCRNEWSWNSLINGCIKCGTPQHALNLYQRMRAEKPVLPSGHTFVAVLKACAKLRNLREGIEIHAEISKSAVLGRNLFIGNALIDMYAKCGMLAKAQEVFNEISTRSVVSWTSLIAGYAEHGQANKAIENFDQMQREGVSPDPITLVCALKAYGSIRALNKVGDLHALIDRQCLLQKNLVVGNTLVDMYIKCGSLARAQQVFDKLPTRDAVSWTTLIAGYVEHGYGEKAVECFEQMRLEGIEPDAAALICSLKACGSIRAAEKGIEIHAEIEKKGFLERNHAVGNTLVDMYAKCGLVAKAQQVFDMLANHDVVSWTALISGYAECGCGQEAVECFERMQHDGVAPNATTFLCSLKACANIGATEKGGDLHVEIERQGLLEKDIVVGTTLVDMYAKCGSLEKAQQVFDRLPIRDGVSWTALMTGYAQIGRSDNVFYVFNRMLEEGAKPNVVTFLVLLSACNQTSLSNEGEMYFRAMSKDYGIVPTLEHHTCVINFLGHLGQLDKAIAMIDKLPYTPDFVLWQAVLSACRRWGTLEIRKRALEHFVDSKVKGFVGPDVISIRYPGTDSQHKHIKV